MAGQSFPGFTPGCKNLLGGLKTLCQEALEATKLGNIKNLDEERSEVNPKKNFSNSNSNLSSKRFEVMFKQDLALRR